MKALAPLVSGGWRFLRWNGVESESDESDDFGRSESGESDDDFFWAGFGA